MHPCTKSAPTAIGPARGAGMSVARPRRSRLPRRPAAQPQYDPAIPGLTPDLEQQLAEYLEEVDPEEVVVSSQITWMLCTHVGASMAMCACLPLKLLRRGSLLLAARAEARL